MRLSDLPWLSIAYRLRGTWWHDLLPAPSPGIWGQDRCPTAECGRPRPGSGRPGARRAFLAPTVPLDDNENGTAEPARDQLPARFPIGARWSGEPARRGALTCSPISGSTSRSAGPRSYIEESLLRGTQWVVFEPNDEPLWSPIRLNVGTFMNDLFSQGAFQGSTPTDAYLVKCDASNNPQGRSTRGIVNILVGFAPLQPAEFVIFNIQQLAGQA